jgi:hypothetical protein
MGPWLWMAAAGYRASSSAFVSMSALAFVVANTRILGLTSFRFVADQLPCFGTLNGWSRELCVRSGQLERGPIGIEAANGLQDGNEVFGLLVVVDHLHGLANVVVGRQLGPPDLDLHAVRFGPL